MNKQIKWHGSCWEMCTASFSIAEFRAAEELCTFGWFSLKFCTLRCRQGSLPKILFLRCSSYMTHFCLQQPATSPSKEKEDIEPSAGLSTCVLLSPTEMMWKSSKDWQWIATEIWLFFFLILLLIFSCPEENVKDYVAIICWGPNKNRALVWQHQGTNGICHPLQDSRVLGHPQTRSSSCFGCIVSLQRWQRSQEPGIYVTAQRRRTACSSGFLWLTLPGRAGLAAHGEEESWICPIPQAGMDTARLESVKWGKK